MKKLLLITTAMLLALSAPVLACEEEQTLPSLPVAMQSSYNSYMRNFDINILPSIRIDVRNMEQRFPDLFPMDEVSIERRAQQAIDMEKYLRKKHHDGFMNNHQEEESK